MQKQYRIDNNGHIARIFRHPEGYLTCRATVAKAGVMTYRHLDGTTSRELVPPEELQREDALGSLALKPVTDEHPRSFVNSDNYKEHSVGKSLQRVKYANGFVEIDLQIDDTHMVGKVDSGEQRETSPGYTVQLQDAADLPPEDRKRYEDSYGPFDFVQRNRLANHIALTRKARGGSDIALHMDSADGTPVAVMVRSDNDDEPPTAKNPHGVSIMPQIHLDGVTYEVTDTATAQAINQFRKDQEENAAEMSKEIAKAQELVSAHKEKIAELTTQIEELQAEKDKLVGQLDVLTATPGEGESEGEGEGVPAEGGDAGTEPAPVPNPEENMDSEARLKWFKERQQMLQISDRYNLDSEEVEKMTNSELKRKIIESHVGEARADSSDAQIDGAFDMLLQTLGRRDSSYQNVSVTVPSKPQPGSNSTRREDAATQEYKKRLSNRWQERKNGTK